MRVYICGPMRGYPEFNFPAFDVAEETLRHAVWNGETFETVNPARMDREVGFDPTDGDTDVTERFVEDALRRDIAQITECKGLVLLDGWENSTGANLELSVARNIGLRIFRLNGSTLKTHSMYEFSDFQIQNLQKPNSEEVRITSNTGGSKGQKLAQLGALDPNALMEIAKVAGFGTQKYDRYNFLKGYDWSLSYDALQRHLHAFWSGIDKDEESGLPHLAHAGWHCLAMLAFMQRGAGTDDRPV